MFRYGSDPPSGVEYNPMLPDVANDPTGNAADLHKTPDDADSNDSTVGVGTGQGDDMDELPEAVEGSPASTDDPAGADNGEVVFERFNDFPLEVRSMIWMAAAHNAKPSAGIYSFTRKNIRLESGPLYPDISGRVHRNFDKIGHDHPLARPIHELLSWSYEGRWVMTFKPSQQVSALTRDIRALFASCSEARTQLMRCPKLSSSFDFHYRHGAEFSRLGNCNLGSIRPFYYDTDWVCMEEMAYAPTIIPQADVPDEIRCTTDICRVQHLAIPHYGTRHSYYRRYIHLRGDSVWCRLSSLKSVGFHAPYFEISPTSGWEGQTTADERMFLRGFPGSMRGQINCYSDYQVTSSSFGLRKAMRNLENLVDDMRALVREAGTSPHIDGRHFSRLNFCILLNSDFQTELGRMYFREDGSHLDDFDVDDLDSELMSNRLKLLRATS
ncbi:hypothetical protein KVR01_013606 [Diaporthe batatas]|uniref:uncharacterized protein n=1 Tax=Diaporthe batatas TaxID=748121 RepID=UPI001D045770|nr:uncharacterized protein KVR01_013606 [Diaporthe batatas]KAG8156502.1 hypothetical protein KVR01_013606 [Diaporthe batatas]